jgi:hypothetical protein
MGSLGNVGTGNVGEMWGQTDVHRVAKLTVARASIFKIRKKLGIYVLGR